MADLQQEHTADNYFADLKVIGPAVLVTVLTGATYFWGWNYTDAYFERLSIQHRSLDFPVTFYLTQAFMPVFMAFTILAYSMFPAKGSKHTVLAAFKGNTTVFVMVLLMIAFGIDEYPKWHSYVFFANSVFALVAGVILSMKKFSVTEIITRPSRALRLLGVLVAILIVSLVSRYLGSLHAQKTVDGSLHNVVSIDIDTAETFPVDFSDKQLILVLHRNGNYYVVEKESEVPKFPSVHIVPDSQVNYAVQERIN